MDHNVVRRWLRQVLAPYPSSDRVYADVDAVLEAFSSLAPKTEVYTYDTGHTSLLLTLQGTVPVSFRGATYHIPLALWLPRAYPREPPIAYVTPTSTMLVRPGGGVDVSGRIEAAPYLQAWLKKWEACNLLELIHSLQESFGKAPPVYAKPASPAPAPAPAPALASPSPAPTANIQDPRQRPPPPVASPSLAGPPSRPPKPGQSHLRSDSLPPPSPGPSGYASPQTYTASPAHSYDASPRHFSAQQQEAPAQAPWSGSHGHSASLSYSPMQHQQQQHRQGSWSAAPAAQSPSSAAPPVPPPPHSAGAVASPSQQHQQPPQHQPALTPAPPRPPNPELLSLQHLLNEKLSSQLQAFHQTSTARAQQLQLLVSDLERGAPAVHDEMARLEAVRDVCKATGDGLDRSVNEAKERIRELDARGEVSPDELICATSIVGNQLINLVASDNAIEDCLYHLGRALNAEQVDLERFLKQTRFLAREQFMKRALSMRICAGMGWDDEGAMPLQGGTGR